MNSAFNDQILADKLRKLNNSQQSIETLSHWCIFHRKKAQRVVEMWDKQLRELSKEQRVPFLYLANDILQNSRRRGLDYVREFWKVLPEALNDVIEKGDSHLHTVVFRLVDIWDERRVFGSRSRTLREELLGNDPPTDLREHRVKSNHTIRIKVPAGGIQEKVTSAYRSVHDVVSDEDAMLGRCNAAVIRVDGLEKEANLARSFRESQDTNTLTEELQEQRRILSQCSEQLDMCELARAALVSCLKEALREQESKCKLIRTQRQTARTRAERSANLRQHLLTSSDTGEIVQLALRETDSNGAMDLVVAASLSKGDKDQWKPLIASEEGMASAVDDDAKKPTASAAAEVAAKLAASSSSAQVLTSVLSSMVAEEASNMRSASAPLDLAVSGVCFGEKRQRLEGLQKSREGSMGFFLQPSTLMPLQSSSMPHYAGLDMAASQHTQMQYPPPPPPPLPPLSQYTGHHGGLGMVAYGYTGVGIQSQIMVGSTNLQGASVGTSYASSSPQPPAVNAHASSSPRPPAVNAPALQLPSMSMYRQPTVPTSLALKGVRDLRS